MLGQPPEISSRSSGVGNLFWRILTRVPSPTFSKVTSTKVSKPVEPALPVAPVCFDPLRCVLQLGGAKPAPAGPSDFLGGHEFGVLEDPHVLVDAGERHPEWQRELADRCGTLSEAFEDGPACGIRQGRGRSVETHLESSSLDLGYGRSPGADTPTPRWERPTSVEV
jgi:hypothetical protein